MKIGILAGQVPAGVDENADWVDAVLANPSLACEAINVLGLMRDAEPGARSADFPVAHQFMGPDGAPEAFTIELILRVRLGNHPKSEAVYGP